MKLTCELCGGELQMTSGKEGAVCTGCGITYSVERLREMLGNSTSESVKTQQETQQETTEKTTASKSNTNTGAVRYMHIKKKFDLHICKMAVVVDGEQVAILKGAGKVTTIPISQGEHKIFLRVASGAGLIETEETTINVGDFDFVGEAGLFRGAFKAAYALRLGEMK